MIHPAYAKGTRSTACQPTFVVVALRDWQEALHIQPIQHVLESFRTAVGCSRLFTLAQLSKNQLQEALLSD
eukprot:scaffold168_cov245-Pinguiococcus_pyrenoidosus.AAC.1